MKVLILGVDGYLGWSLALRLLKRGDEVCGVDNGLRRRVVEEVGGHSAIPIRSLYYRVRLAKKFYGEKLDVWAFADVTNYQHVEMVMKKFKPDAVFHLAEIPSAPYSQISVEHAIFTMRNNIEGTLNVLFAMKEHVPDAHLIKLGTMGEYGTPNIDIPEGFFEVEYKGRKDVLPFPKQAGSFYHWTKVHDSGNIMYACKIWDLSSTDIMQGVIYGTNTAEISETGLTTRFDFDEIWGTSLNRYCAQAVVGYPLTVYGEGGQTRGYISLRDAITCYELILDNPPKKGEYRVINQYDETYSVMQLAELVQKVGGELGLSVEIRQIPDPRKEAERHYYNPCRDTLHRLGYCRKYLIEEEIRFMLAKLALHEDRILEKKERMIKPTVYWGETKWRR